MDDQPSLFDQPCPICNGVGRVWDPRIGADRMCSCLYEQLPAPDVNPAAPAGIESRGDEIRLNRQQAKVWATINDGCWHTLAEIAGRTGFPEASISARFRDLRKEKYGEHEIERESMGGGLFRYRLIPNPRVRVG